MILRSRYVIERELGHGGTATVYLGRDMSVGGTEVAIKKLHLPAFTEEVCGQFSQQFKKEAQILAGLSHPGIVRITDYLEEDGSQYLVMSLVRGKTLEEILQGSEGFPPIDRVLDWMDQLCDVLCYLHTQDPPVLFKDLKPSNLMLDASGRLILIDFGLARFLVPGEHTKTLLKGFLTPGYAPVEQYSGTTDPRSDIYALGATIYSLLTRTVPTDAVERVVGAIHLLSPRAVNSQIPQGLEDVVLRMMRINPFERYQTAAAAREAVQAVAISWSRSHPAGDPGELPVDAPSVIGNLSTGTEFQGVLNQAELLIEACRVAASHVNISNGPEPSSASLYQAINHLTAARQAFLDAGLAQRPEPLLPGPCEVRVPLGALCNGVAHEYNNLLTPAEATLHGLRTHDGPLDPLEIADLEHMVEQGRAIAHTLLTLARGDHHERQALSVEAIAEDVLTLLQGRFDLCGTRVQRRHSWAPPVMGSVGGLQQVILSLLIQAEASLDKVPGEIEVSTGTFAGEAYLSVTDNGSGRWQLLNRETPTSTRSGGDLVAALSIVEAHNGRLLEEVRPGRGSTFRVLLPALKGDPTPQPVSKPLTVRVRLAASASVLVVDDDDRVLRMLKRFLSSRGFEVVSINNGEMALQAVRSRPFDAILLDLAMPGLKGQDVLQQLQREVPKTPVVILSGSVDAVLEGELLAQGASQVLCKPVDLNLLLQTLIATISKSSQAESLPS